MSGPCWREGPSQDRAGLEDLPPDVLERIAELGFTSLLSPLFDRGDLLHQACTLACVGNSTCTSLAQLLFAELSPRLGQELPGGVSQKSSAAQLKAALKEWGLPNSGSKPDLWQRLLDEVQDSEAGAGGAPPAHCIVSGATRRELAGARHRRVTLNAAKKTFDLAKYELEGLPSAAEASAKGEFVRTYLLADVKAKALALHGSWEKLTGKKAGLRDMLDKFKQDRLAQRERRLAELRAELATRGLDPALVADVMRSPGINSYMWGTRDKLAAGLAADWLERLAFCVGAEELMETFGEHYTYDFWRPPKHMSQCKVREEKLIRAANGTLRCFAGWAGSLSELRGDARIPPSLLPELERLWRETHPPAGRQHHPSP